MSTSTIIFDFDGTIADTMGLIQSILARVAPDFGYPPVTRAQFDAARALTLREILKRYHLSWWKLPLILRRVRREQRALILEAPLAQGMGTLLETLRAQGCRLGILSNNREDTVRAFCAHHQLAGFEFVYTVGSLFGKGSALKKVLRKQKIDPHTVVYIGDETKDIEAGREAGTQAIAVTWGFHAKELLTHAEPRAVANTTEELMRAIQQLISR